MKNSRTSYFTKRGNYFGNVWHVYSEKNKASFKLFSDGELAHWLLFLEFNPNIYEFKLNEIGFGVFPNGKTQSAVYSAQVLTKDGSREWRQVVRSESSAESSVCNELNLRQEIALINKVNFRIYSDADLVPTKYKIMPLLRVAACLAAGKRYALPTCLMVDAYRYIEERQSGSMSEFMSAMSEYEASIACYAFAKLYSDGVIKVDFDKAFFAYSTRWISHDKENF